MEFISENWAFIVLIIAAIVVGIVFAIRRRSFATCV